MEREKAKKNISNDLQTIGDKSGSIPLDLMWAIFQRLPVETLVMFLCVSKHSASIIRNRNFMKSYLMKCMTRPQSLIFTFKGLCSRERYFFSFNLLQTQNQSSSLATYLMKCPSSRTFGPSVHGLICYGSPSEVKIYNPSTRRSITLPKIEPQKIDMFHFLGYDPIDGDYKVLGVTIETDTNKKCYSVQELWVLTLGNENSWRLIEDFPPHLLEPDNQSPDICIDGVLYYKALLNTELGHAVISFDVQSETFHLIEGPEKYFVSSFRKLTSYKKKLGVVLSAISDHCIYLWVLEDAVKHEWSKKFYVIPQIYRLNSFHRFATICALDGGEIVLATSVMFAGEPYYVLIYDPSKDTVRRVCIEGFPEVDHKDVLSQTLSIFPGEIVLATNVMISGEPYYVLIYDPRKNSVRRVYIKEFPEVDYKDGLSQTLSIFPGQVENFMFL